MSFPNLSWSQIGTLGGPCYNGPRCSDTGQYLIAVATISGSQLVQNSSDGGETWSTVSGSSGAYACWISGNGKYQYYVLASGGTYGSSDYGAPGTWGQLTAFPTGTQRGGDCSADGQKIIVPVQSGSAGAYVSTNGGTAASNTSSDDVQRGVAYSRDGTQVVAGSSSNLQYSASDGGSWATGSGTSGSRWDGVQFSQDGTVIFISKSSGSVPYYSADQLNSITACASGPVCYERSDLATFGAAGVIATNQNSYGVYIDDAGGASAWTTQTGLPNNPMKVCCVPDGSLFFAIDETNGNVYAASPAAFNPAWASRSNILSSTGIY